ncbi:hypothetical protein PHMEG_00030535 [Phytophthora megakarya]|uniref:WRKY19-like zinc finger domain-containing protein n=1 Tax=Phytophthora megakarya TaxID=4795 RepID=A0A225V0U9_9STRA|nr:hypothetical protein PHMEG_00030535 [Phytophthora megakarya]
MLGQVQLDRINLLLLTLCKTHHITQMSNQIDQSAMISSRIRRKAARCSVPNCNKQVQTLKLCKAHGGGGYVSLTEVVVAAISMVAVNLRSASDCVSPMEEVGVVVY